LEWSWGCSGFGDQDAIDPTRPRAASASKIVAALQPLRPARRLASPRSTASFVGSFDIEYDVRDAEDLGELAHSLRSPRCAESHSSSE